MELTEAEVERLLRRANTRKAPTRDRTSGWTLFFVQVGLGVLVALLAVVTHAARPDKAGVIAVGGWLACWAAMAVYARAVQRASRHDQRRSWELAGRSYTVVAGPAGVRVTFREHATEMVWHGFTRVDVWKDFVLIWSRGGSAVAVPIRALPGQWSVPDLTARLSACIQDARERVYPVPERKEG